MKRRSTTTKIELLNSELLKRYTSIAKTEYSKRTPICSNKYLRWKYLENPLGKSYGVNCYSDNSLVGMVSYQKKQFIVNGEIVNGANLSDLIIKKEERRLDLFLKLTESILIKKNIPGKSLSIMIPNRIAIDLYKNILKLNSIGSLEIRCLPINIQILMKPIRRRKGKRKESIVNKMLGRVADIMQNFSTINFSSYAPNKKEYDVMIDQYYQDNLVQGERSWEWHKWRYSNKSKICYTLQYIYLGNELIGYIAYRKVTKGSLEILMIMEIVLIQNGFFIELAILGKVLRSAFSAQVDLIMDIRTRQKCNPLNNIILFPRVPSFMIKSPLELFVLSDIELPEECFNIKCWKLNMADGDIF